jgi:type IV pilus assembly protein PilF
MKHIGTALSTLALSFLVGCASTPTEPAGQPGAARQAAEVNTSLGREYMSRGQFEIALEKLRKAVKADPKYAPAHTVLAVLYEQIDEPELARRHYRQAVDANPDNGDVNNNYGTFLCKQGDSRLAQQYFARALDDPFYRTPQVAYANAGTCALQAGNLDKAEEFLRKSLAYDAEFADALLPLASISYRSGDFLRARAFLQRYEATGSLSAEGLLLGYHVESRLNNSTAAREYAARLVNQFPDSRQAGELRDDTR